ncbi:MAG: O-antigen ligase family protein [Patescibacteria group bacterium]
MNRPQAIKILRTIAMIGIYGGLLMPLVFVPKVIFPFVFSKLIYLQILIGLTFPAYLTLAWIEPKYRPKWVPLTWAIIAYFAALAISVVFAVDVPKAWWGNQERMNGLFTLLHFFAWYLMASSLLTTWKQWKRILMYEVVLSGIMGLVTILQVPFPDLLLFPATGRLGGLLDNPIYMAAYQIFNLFFIVLLWLKGVSKSTKVWLVLFALLDIGAFILAESRGPLVGLAAGILVFGVVYAWFSNRKTKTIVIGAVVAFFLAYGVLFALRNTSFVMNSPLERFTNFQTTVDTRFIAWKIAWDGFLQRPLTGWGLDDFHILFNLKYNPQSLRFTYYETWFDRAHNTVMDALSMTGIFGTLTFFGLYITLFYSVIKAYKKKWIDLPIASILLGLPVAYFTQNLFVFDQPAGFTMSFLMFALVAAATMAEFTGAKDDEKPEEKAKASSAKSVPWVVFAILQLAALFVVWRYSWLPAEASYYSIESNNYFSAGVYPEAFALAQKAAAIPTPYLDEQTFLQSSNLMRLEEAGTIQQQLPNWKAWHDLVVDLDNRYLAAHPINTNPLFVYARFLDDFGSLVPADVPLAEQEYLKAIQTSPERQQLFYSLGRFYIEHGDKQKGYDYFKQAEDFDPEIGESHWYVGLTLAYDQNNLPDGSKEMVAAFEAPYPYSLKSVQEATALADAFVVVNDPTGLKNMITTTLPTLPGGTAEMFFQIARDAEKLGLTEQRNLILGALAQDPTIAARLQPLVNGSATSIDESLDMTQGLASSTLPTAAPTTQATPPTSTTQTAATSAADNGSGPRLNP